MANQAESVHTLEFLLSEANGQRSREQGTTAAAVKAGSVVELSGTEWIPVANAAPTGKTLAIACADAASGDKVALITRDAEVSASTIDWGVLVAGANRDAAVAILKAAGIIIR